jgi:hypothetical protein
LKSAPSFAPTHDLDPLDLQLQRSGPLVGQQEAQGVDLLRVNRPGVLHDSLDDMVPFADSEELVRSSGQAASALIEVGDDQRLADPEPLRKMLEACERASGGPTP